MSNVVENLEFFLGFLPENVKLVAVSKLKPINLLMELYNIGFKSFGENYVQELCSKHQQMPKDVEWHFIGHLQSNKVKYIAPFVRLIHSVDSYNLLQEINKQALKNQRVIDCLIQIYIAEEDTKTGFEKNDFLDLIKNDKLGVFKNIRIKGLMGMSTFTENRSLIEKEFKNLKEIFEEFKLLTENISNFDLTEISMGMSGDYKLAISAGSTMVRVGSSIFGNRI